MTLLIVYDQDSNSCKYFEPREKGPKDHLKPAAGGKLFTFCDAIIAYHSLTRNPRFAMEAIN